ncbi:MAG: hypothetical protein J4G13_01535 [Dehalococcoidia bacterium]|nr:hypothetical protein [Dehalococcoidia bacterium]
MNQYDHTRAAFRFLQLADTLTIEQDKLARSEMLWCAAAHIVKAIAVQREWDNDRHEEIFDAARKIHGAIGYPDTISDFYNADNLHRNMYRGSMSEAGIREAEGKVRRFVNRVADAVNNYQSPNNTP